MTTPLILGVGLALVVAAAVCAYVLYRRRAGAPASLASLRPGSPDLDQWVLSQLRESGSDLTQPTEVTFFMIFPNEARAKRAAMQSSAPALTAVAEADAESADWFVRVTSHMVPSESAIREISLRLVAVAETNAGVYDGWEAAVSR